MFYEDVLMQAARTRPPVRLVAATPPGFARRPAPPDVSIESFARRASRLARLGCRIVAGHSLGANVAIEMALSHGFDGALVLVSPSFSREGEFRLSASSTGSVASRASADLERDVGRRRDHMLITEQPQRIADAILAAAGSG